MSRRTAFREDQKAKPISAFRGEAPVRLGDPFAHVIARDAAHIAARDAAFSGASEPSPATLADQVCDAIDELIEAKMDYAETRRGPSAEYASSEPVMDAKNKLRELLERAREFAR